MKLMPRLYVAALLLPILAIASSLTNADIVKMSEAKLDESIILTAIENSEPKFDTSATGLIELSSAKVSQAIISAMIKRTATPEKSLVSASASGASPSISPQSTFPTDAGEKLDINDVLFIDGDKRERMVFSTPGERHRSIPTPIGDVGHTYWTLEGGKANTRTQNTNPSFMISFASNQRVQEHITLLRWEARSNGTREIGVGAKRKGFFVSNEMSGVRYPPERVIPIEASLSQDQKQYSNAIGRIAQYIIRPTKPLAPGEYVLLTESHSAYDFGVDP